LKFNSELATIARFINRLNTNTKIEKNKLNEVLKESEKEFSKELANHLNNNVKNGWKFSIEDNEIFIYKNNVKKGVCKLNFDEISWTLTHVNDGLNKLIDTASLYQTIQQIADNLSLAFNEQDGEYDGLVVKNVYDYGENDNGKERKSSNVYVAFKANQIKDINNKKPTSNPDIRFSRNKKISADDVFDIFAEETGMDYAEDREEFQNWLSEHPDYEELINEAYGEDDEYSDFDDDYDFDDENTSDEDEDNYDDSEYKKNVKWSNSFNSDGEEISIQQEKFFEESKFRNEEEDLLVLYHGSNKAGFMTFNSETGVFFFTPYRDVASSYTRSGRLVVTKKFKTADELINWWYDKGASEMGKNHAGIDILPKEYAEREIEEYLDFLEEYYPEEDEFINFKRKSFRYGYQALVQRP
jgi:hypothetical protein